MMGVSDLNAKGKKGNAEKTLNFLKMHGIKLAMTNARMMSTVGLDAFDLG